jgi:hypothetical protein
VAVGPACPGPGYTWVEGYFARNGVWIAGYWAPPAVVLKMCGSTTGITTSVAATCISTVTMAAANIG